jgi:2-polyprenyl-6-methoxyphenol hydroxylase-like FAD-dependent oxidoreductase
MYIRLTPSDGTRGGVILPMEDDRWYVTLIGVAGDYPPTDEAGFLAFARNLPTPRLYEAIRNATPLTKPIGFRRTENRVRRYDRLPRYLEGFLVGGDAAYALNPIYAQGMTAAAMGAQALERSLLEHRRRRGAGDVTGLAEAFQRQLSEAIVDVWHLATRRDWDWPITEVTDTIFRPTQPVSLPLRADRAGVPVRRDQLVSAGVA